MEETIEDTKFRFFQLQKIIEPLDWQYRQIKNSVGNLEWGFGTIIDYEPELQRENTYRYSFGFPSKMNCRCKYFHRKLRFILFLSSTNNSGFIKMRTCFHWKNKTEENDFIAENREQQKSQNIYECSPECRSYSWAFDQCMIKMQFPNLDNTVSLTKSFHVEPESDICQTPQHLAVVDEADEIASFVEDTFLTHEELESKTAYKMCKGNKKFIPVEILISSRIYLAAWNRDNTRAPEDRECSLPTENFQVSVSTNMSKRMRLATLTESIQVRTASGGDSDAILLAGPDLRERLAVRKSILADRSPVFHAMFQTDMQERKSGEIKMEGYSYIAVKSFVDYLYDGRSGIPNNWEVEFSFEVMQLAHQYEVSDLVELCVDNIIVRPNSDLTRKSALDIFVASVLYKKPDLYFRSLQWIKRNKDLLMTTEGKQDLIRALRNASLNIDYDLFIRLL